MHRPIIVALLTYRVLAVFLLFSLEVGMCTSNESSRIVNKVGAVSFTFVRSESHEKVCNALGSVDLRMELFVIEHNATSSFWISLTTIFKTISLSVCFSWT